MLVGVLGIGVAGFYYLSRSAAPTNSTRAVRESREGRLSPAQTGSRIAPSRPSNKPRRAPSAVRQVPPPAPRITAPTPSARPTVDASIYRQAPAVAQYLEWLQEYNRDKLATQDAAMAAYGRIRAEFEQDIVAQFDVTAGKRIAQAAPGLDDRLRPMVEDVQRPVDAFGGGVKDFPSVIPPDACIGVKEAYRFMLNVQTIHLSQLLTGVQSMTVLVTITILNTDQPHNNFRPIPEVWKQMDEEAQPTPEHVIAPVRDALAALHQQFPYLDARLFELELR